MNNMNFRRQTNCQGCGNCNCRQQNQPSEPDCRCGNPGIEPRNENGCNRQTTPQRAGGCNMQNANPVQNNSNCDSAPNRPHENCRESISHIDMHNIPIGIGYVPWQKWRKINALCDGLSQGTIFKELSLPFYGCIPTGFCNDKGGAR